jgi:hypothetical protein
VRLSQAFAFLWPAISLALRYRGLTMRSQHKQDSCAYNLARQDAESCRQKEQTTMNWKTWLIGGAAT